MSELKIKGRKGNGHKGEERRKGFGTLEKRRGVFLARWQVNGKRFSQNTRTGDRREAEAILEKLTAPYRLKDEAERLEVIASKLGGVRSQLANMERERPALPLADGWAAFVNSPARPDTAGAARLEIMERVYKKFVSFMGAKFADVREVRGVTKDHAQAFALAAFEGLCNATRNQSISALRQVWKILKEDGAARIVANPFEGIKKKRETHTRRRELTIDELKRVCRSLSGEMRLLFAVGIYTGLRLGDCALLEWDNFEMSFVDLARRIISVVPRKTARKCGTRVDIPIHSVLFAMLAETSVGNRHGYVMPECAKLYAEGHLSDRVTRVFKSAGIETQTASADSSRKRPLVSFHSLRHTFVSMGANAGIPLAVIQSIVGHSDEDMTRHYFHASSAATAQAVGALPDVLGEGCAAYQTPVGVGASERVRVACAMIDEMTDAEREAVRDHLNGGAVAASPSGVALLSA